jgi:Tfp pilus assembly protein PilV
MARLEKKLSGSTLIETLVAMTLLVTAIALAFLSVIKINKSFNNDLRTYAYITAKKYIEETHCVSLENEIFEYPTFSIEVSREQWKDNPKLFILTVTSFTQDSITLYETRRIIKIDSVATIKSLSREKI